MSHCGNNSNPCLDCGREQAIAEQVEDDMRLGKLGDQMLEYAVQHDEVGESVWECKAQRAVREAMQEFLIEQGLQSAFEAYLLAEAALKADPRVALENAWRIRNHLVPEPEVRTPNAAARCIIATIEGDAALREAFEADEIARRLEPAEVT